MNDAECLIVMLLCRGYDDGPVGPNVWLCRLAWWTLWAGQPFDTDTAIAEHADWLNRPDQAESRANLAGAIDWLRRMAAKPRPVWKLPNDAGDLFNPINWGLSPEWSAFQK